MYCNAILLLLPFRCDDDGDDSDVDDDDDADGDDDDEVDGGGDDDYDNGDDNDDDNDDDSHDNKLGQPKQVLNIMYVTAKNCASTATNPGACFCV